MNDDSTRQLDHDLGASVTGVSNFLHSNTRINDFNFQAIHQQIQEEQGEGYNSTMFSFVGLTLGTKRPSKAIPRRNIHNKPYKRSRNEFDDSDASDSNWSSPSPLGGLKSRIPPLISSLVVCTSRMDLWAHSDMSFILPRVGCKMERRALKSIPSCEDSRLYNSSLLIFLDKTDMAREMSDTADVTQELDAHFPELLTMRRFPTWTFLKEDIIQVQVRKDPFIDPRIRGNFRAFLNRIAMKLKFQGILTLIGDTESFWAGHVPEDHTSRSKSVQIVPELSKGLRTFPNLKLSNKNYDKPFATASRYVQGTTIYSDSRGLQMAHICIACTETKAFDDLLPMPGGVHCCRNCKEKYFDDCRACLNLVRKPISVSLPCEHSFCQDCLIHKFESSNHSPDDFPPRCCDQELFIHHFREHLPDQVVRGYLAMLLRKLTQKEMACATIGCEGRIIKHYNVVGNWALCPDCVQLTCCKCSHLRMDHKIVDNVQKCPRDEQEKLLKLAEENEWKTCPKCQNIVSRNGGCNTMRCRCGQGFCYTCGEAFEGTRTTCGCPMTFEGGVPDAAPAEIPEGQVVDGWPEPEAMFNCTHANTTPTAEHFCHGCLRDREDIHLCDHCFAALCSACRTPTT